MYKRKKLSIFILFLSVFFTFYSCNSNKNSVANSGVSKASLKNAFENNFHIGTTLNTWQIMGRQSEELKVATENFNSIVAENIMKSARIQPKEGEFNFKLADEFVKIGEENNMHIHGHTLIWHSQAPEWFFVDEDGNKVSKEVLTQRMKDHIHTVVGR
jgi:endo-1,4-beta-xylanase